MARRTPRSSKHSVDTNLNFCRSDNSFKPLSDRAPFSVRSAAAAIARSAVQRQPLGIASVKSSQTARSLAQAPVSGESRQGLGKPQVCGNHRKATRSSPPTHRLVRGTTRNCPSIQRLYRSRFSWSGWFQKLPNRSRMRAQRFRLCVSPRRSSIANRLGVPVLNVARHGFA